VIVELMFKIFATNEFKKDLKRIAKRNYNLKLLDEVISLLANGEQLPVKYRDHLLTGKLAGYRECHIQPDWLLIYKIEEKNLILYLLQTGTHSDLFD